MDGRVEVALLGPVEYHAGGYRLALGPERLDITRVQRLAADGRALAGRDPDRAAAAIGGRRSPVAR